MDGVFGSMYVLAIAIEKIVHNRIVVYRLGIAKLGLHLKHERTNFCHVVYHADAKGK